MDPIAEARKIAERNLSTLKAVTLPEEPVMPTTEKHLKAAARAFCKASGQCKYVGQCNTGRCTIAPEPMQTAVSAYLRSVLGDSAPAMLIAAAREKADYIEREVGRRDAGAWGEIEIMREQANLIEAQASSLTEAQERIAGLENFIRTQRSIGDRLVRGVAVPRDEIKAAVALQEAVLPQAAPAQRQEAGDV